MAGNRPTPCPRGERDVGYSANIAPAAARGDSDSQGARFPSTSERVTEDAVTRIFPKNSPPRTIPLPSSEEWGVLCEYLGILSGPDLARTIEQAELWVSTRDAALRLFSHTGGDGEGSKAASIQREREGATEGAKSSWDSPGSEEIAAALDRLGIVFAEEDNPEAGGEANSVSGEIPIPRTRLRRDRILRTLLRWRTGERKRLRLDRKARWLALRKPVVGDLHDPYRPPNTPDELGEVLPGLIELDQSVLSRWYVQHLLSQLNIWRDSGTEEEKKAAKMVSENIGKAFVLSLNRGPKTDEKRLQEEAKRISEISDNVWKDAKEAWRKHSKAADRYQFMADRWGQDIVPSKGDPCYRKPKPQEAATEIAMRRCNIRSEGDLKRKRSFGKRPLREKAKPLKSGS